MHDTYIKVPLAAEFGGKKGSLGTYHWVDWRSDRTEFSLLWGEFTPSLTWLVLGVDPHGIFITLG